MSESATELIEIAVDLIREADAAGIVIRLAGSLAVEFHAVAHDRPLPPADIDLVSRSHQRRLVQEYLVSRDWILRKELLLVSETRDVFARTGNDLSIDIYYDVIDGNHPIAVSEERLRGGYPTIPAAELLLSKLQRRSLRDVDRWDCCALIAVQMLGDDVVFQMLARDWGLYQSAESNLHALKKVCDGLSQKIDDILSKMMGYPKTFKWKLRAMMGHRWRSWREVYQPKRRSSR